MVVLALFDVQFSHGLPAKEEVCVEYGTRQFVVSYLILRRSIGEPFSSFNKPQEFHVRVFSLVNKRQSKFPEKVQLRRTHARAAPAAASQLVTQSV